MLPPSNAVPECIKAPGAGGRNAAPGQGTLDVTMRGMRNNCKTVAAALLVFGCGATTGAQQAGHVETGVFEAHGDVGVTPKQGSVVYDSVSGEYRVSGGGANIWARRMPFNSPGTGSPAT